MKKLFLPITFALTFASFGLAQNPALPHVLHTYNLGGEGGWDYFSLDSASRHIYLSRSSHIVVVDADNGEVVGNIPDTPGVHGVALAQDLGLGFTSNGRSNSVTCFDLKTFKLVRTISPVGEGPDAIIYDPFSKRVFTFNGHARSVTAIDGATGSIVGTLTLPGSPEFAVTDGAGKIYLNLEDKGQLITFGAKDLKIEAAWPLGEVVEPSGLAIDIANGRVYSTGGNSKVAVLDTKTGKLLATVPSGVGSDAAVYDPSNGITYVSNGEGTLTVIRGLNSLGSVPTAPGARTMALDEKTHHVFLVTAEYEAAPIPSSVQPHPRRTIRKGSFKLIEMGG